MVICLYLVGSVNCDGEFVTGACALYVFFLFGWGWFGVVGIGGLVVFFLALVFLIISGVLVMEWCDEGFGLFSVLVLRLKVGLSCSY